MKNWTMNEQITYSIYKIAETLGLPNDVVLAKAIRLGFLDANAPPDITLAAEKIDKLMKFFKSTPPPKDEKTTNPNKPEADLVELEQSAENSDDCDVDANGKMSVQGELQFLHELLQDKLRNSSAEAQARFHSDTSAVRVQTVPYFGLILLLEGTLPRVRHGEQVDAFGFVGSPEAPVAIEEMFGDEALEEIREEIRQQAIVIELLPDVAVAVWNFFRGPNSAQDRKEIAHALSGDVEFLSQIFSARALPHFLNLIPDSRPVAGGNALSANKRVRRERKPPTTPTGRSSSETPTETRQWRRVASWRS